MVFAQLIAGLARDLFRPMVGVLLASMLVLAGIGIGQSCQSAVAQNTVTQIPVPGAVVPSYQPQPGQNAYVVRPEHVRGFTDATSTLEDDLADFTGIDTSGAEEGQCLQWMSGAFAFGMCTEIAVSGAFTGYVAYSPNRAFIAEEFTESGRPNASFMGTYTSVGGGFSARINYPFQKSGTWGYRDGVCSNYCGYVGLALPTPPGRPSSIGSGFGGRNVDQFFFTQGTLPINGVTHTILVGNNATQFLSFSNFTEDAHWPEWRGTGLGDIAEGTAPVPAHDHAWQPGAEINKTGTFSPGSDTTMIVGWWTCNDSSACSSTGTFREAENARFESGNTFTWPDRTGTVYPFVAYNFPNSTAPSTITTTTDTTTNLRSQWITPPGNVRTTYTTDSYAYVLGPAVTNPTNFQRIVTR